MPSLDTGYPKKVYAVESGYDALLLTDVIRDKEGYFWVTGGKRVSGESYRKPWVARFDPNWNLDKQWFDTDFQCSEWESTLSEHRYICSIAIRSDGSVHIIGYAKKTDGVRHLYYSYLKSNNTWETFERVDVGAYDPNRQNPYTYRDAKIECNGDDDLLIAWQGKGWDSRSVVAGCACARIKKADNTWTSVSWWAADQAGYGAGATSPCAHWSQNSKFLLLFKSSGSSASFKKLWVKELYASGSGINESTLLEWGIQPDLDGTRLIFTTPNGSWYVLYEHEHGLNDYIRVIKAGTYDYFPGTTRKEYPYAVCGNNSDRIYFLYYDIPQIDDHAVVDKIMSQGVTSGWGTELRLDYARNGSFIGVSRTWPQVFNGSEYVRVALPSQGALFLCSGSNYLGEGGNPGIYAFAFDGLTWPAPISGGTFVCSGEIPLSASLEGAYAKRTGFKYIGGELPIWSGPEALHGPGHGFVYREAEIGLETGLLSTWCRGFAVQGDLTVESVLEGAFLPAVSPDVILRNKLLVWADVALKSRLAVSSDYTLPNRLTAEVSRDVALRSRICAAVSRDISIRNGLEGPGVFRDLTIRVPLLPDPAALIKSHTWDVTLGGQSIREDLLWLTITMEEESFANTVEGVFKGLDALEALEAHRGTGEDVLEVVIDGAAWRFLVEEVEFDRRSGQGRFWGRSRTARLADPRYADPVTKVWEVPTLASAVIAELAQGFTVQNDLADHLIPAGVLSAENDMPLDIIRRIAEAQGGLVRSGPLGELVLRPRYPVAPAEIQDAAPWVVLTDLDDLLDLGQEEVPGEGWNAVLVEGRSTEADQPALILELDPERNRGKTVFKPGEDAWVRLYPRPWGIGYEHQITLGDAFFAGEHVAEIQEEIEIADGVARLSKPIHELLEIAFDGREFLTYEWDEGGQEIRFEAAEGCSGSGFCRVKYTARYHLWRVTASQQGTSILCVEKTDE